MSKTIKGGLQAFLLATAAALALWPLSDRPAPAQENSPPTTKPEGSVARGRVAFRIYCASCHGVTAQGDGPVGTYLKIPPSNLTRLSAKNKGEFPEERVYSIIDGRDVPSHGSRDMPVWGLSFQTPEKDSNQEAEVRSRILDLTAFLRSIQGTPAK
jgi:mono/diheme cytochrome c family protein